MNEVMLLLVISVVEVLALVAVLAIYLLIVQRQLKNIALYLGKVTFGVRAIEQQCASIGPAVTNINGTLRDIVGALPGIASKAEGLARV